MNRRSLFKAFGATAAGLLIPIEAQRVYSFCGGWAVDWLDDVKDGELIKASYGVRGTDRTIRLCGSAYGCLHYDVYAGAGSIDREMVRAIGAAFVGQTADASSARRVCQLVRYLA